MLYSNISNSLLAENLVWNNLVYCAFKNFIYKWPPLCKCLLGAVILWSCSSERWILSRFGHVNVGGHMLMILWCHDQDDFFWLSCFCSSVSVNVLAGLACCCMSTWQWHIKLLLQKSYCLWYDCVFEFLFVHECFPWALSPSAFTQTSSGRSSHWRWIHRLNYGNFMHYGMSHNISYKQLLHSRNQNAQKQAHI